MCRGQRPDVNHVGGFLGFEQLERITTDLRDIDNHPDCRESGLQVQGLGAGWVMMAGTTPTEAPLEGIYEVHLRRVDKGHVVPRVQSPLLQEQEHDLLRPLVHMRTSQGLAGGYSEVNSV